LSSTSSVAQTASVQVSTFAGTGIPGVVDGPAATAQFHAPKGMAFDAQGNMLVAEAFKCLIRKVSTTGLVSTLAGTGVCGSVDGPVATAQFQNPQNLAIDLQGNIFLTDNRSIRKISPDGIVSTLAGTGVLGFADGPGATAQFENAGGLALDFSGNLFVTEPARIRKVTPGGFVSTVAGTGTAGYQDGSGVVAQFKSLGDIDIDREGNLYVADTFNNRIRKVSVTGLVSTVGGNGNPGFVDGPSDSAQFLYPQDVVVDGAGNLFVTDEFNYRVRKIAVTGIVSTLAGSGTAGFLDGDALTAQFWLPLGLEMDSLGNLYVTEAGTTLADPYRRIRKISTPGIPFGTNPGTSTTTTTTSVPVATNCPAGLGSDADGDCLPDSSETQIGTSPSNPDTDGDGLLDSWEAPNGVPGAGYWVGGQKVDQDYIFGLWDGKNSLKYGSGTVASCLQANPVDAQSRVSGSGFSCFNHRPNPLRKDVYVEMDWEDCAKGLCPETPIGGIDIDPNHHSPNVSGLKDVVDMFASAPVGNPDGSSGVTLNLVVDDQIKHKPNCATVENIRAGFEGSDQQRFAVGNDPLARFFPGSPTYGEVLGARAKSVRYVWAGHAIDRVTLKPDGTLEPVQDIETNGSANPVTRDCLYPSFVSLMKQGMGLENLPSFDFSQWGTGTGKTIAAAMSGAAWVCSPDAKLDGLIYDAGLWGLSLTPGTIFESKSACYRNTRAGVPYVDSTSPLNPFSVGGKYLIINPGIYPAKIKPYLSQTTTFSLKAPIQMLLGESGESSARQLWSRGLSNLLGQSMGLSYAEAGNDPVVYGRKQTTPNQLLGPVLPGSFNRWTNLDFAPGNNVRKAEGGFPPFDVLASEDPDNDGVPNGTDNCPVISNPGQQQTEFRSWLSTIPRYARYYVEWGTACDGDIDGDGMVNLLPVAAPAAPATAKFLLGAVAPAPQILPDGRVVDPYPNDSDNDGIPNGVDTDSDGDGAANASDNCLYMTNVDQRNVDGDSQGDQCDFDADGDGAENSLEFALGANPGVSTSTPEFLGETNTCSNGIDDDGDGQIDAADTGCKDPDGDSNPTLTDNCPTVSNRGWTDSDGDGIGNWCDATLSLESVDPRVVVSNTQIVTVTVSSSVAGSVSIRSGGTCSGALVVSAPIAVGSTPDQTFPVSMTIPIGNFVEGTNSFKVCLTSGLGSDERLLLISKDTGVPTTTTTTLGPTTTTTTLGPTTTTTTLGPTTKCAVCVMLPAGTTVSNGGSTNSITVTGGDVYIHSNSPAALVGNGGSGAFALNTPVGRFVNIVGGTNWQAGPIPANVRTLQPQRSDPLAYVATPVALPTWTAKSHAGWYSANTALASGIYGDFGWGGATLTLNPGVYGSINSGGTSGTKLVLNAGTYIVTGNWALNGQTTITTANNGLDQVTLYFTCRTAKTPRACGTSGELGGSLTTGGLTQVNLRPPATGPLRGMSIFYDRNNSSDLPLNGSTNFSTGAIYAKRSLVNFGSANILTSGQLVIGKLALNSGGKVFATYDATKLP
jgi:Thrombospondin type 3 repeat